MFLLRRNLPLAWAGWYDDFTSYGVTSLRQPWKHLGDGTVADYNALGELHIPANYFTNNGGGESYEFQPFTPNWGLEFEVWWPVEGLAAQSFTCFITDSWARVGAQFQNLVGIQLRHTSGGDTIGMNTYSNIIGFNDHEGQWPVTGYKGRYATVRVWCENDEWLRLWIDGVYQGSFNIFSDTFKLGPDRRCVRFLNAALCDCWMRWIDHYDRTASVPPKTVWSSVQYDDFNGSLGAFWTQIGTGAGISSNSWAYTGGSNGSSGLLWDTGNGSGKVRIEATAGGSNSPNSTADSSLVLCSNAAGTQALVANIYSGALYISNLSGSMTAPTMTDLNSRPSGVTVASGDKIAFSVHNGICWVEINGVPKLYVGQAHGTVPATNTYAGLRVERTSSVNSCSWNDVRIYSGV